MTEKDILDITLNSLSSINIMTKYYYKENNDTIFEYKDSIYDIIKNMNTNFNNYYNYIIKNNIECKSINFNSDFYNKLFYSKDITIIKNIIQNIITNEFLRRRGNYFYITNFELVLIDRFINNKLSNDSKLDKELINFIINNNIIYNFFLIDNNYEHLFKTKELKEELINYFNKIFFNIQNKDKLNKNEIFITKGFIKNFFMKCTKEKEYISLAFNYFNDENFIKDEKAKKEIYKILIKY